MLGRITTIMEKTVGAFEIRRNLGKVLQDIAARGDKYIVERHGEPIAAVVPVEVYEQWKRSRSRLFEQMRRTQANANLSPAEADALAAEAVKAARTP
jgi:prevent-host-death family protein